MKANVRRGVRKLLLFSPIIYEYKGSQELRKNVCKSMVIPGTQNLKNENACQNKTKFIFYWTKKHPFSFGKIILPNEINHILCMLPGFWTLAQMVWRSVKKHWSRCQLTAVLVFVLYQFYCGEGRFKAVSRAKKRFICFSWKYQLYIFFSRTDLMCLMKKYLKAYL